jgi:tetratricopeptide (TPR) repeat protein
MLTVCLLFSTAVFGHGTFHDRLAEIERQIAQKPDAAALYEQRAVIYYSHEDWQAALVDLEKADRLSQGQIDTDLLRGQALDAGGQTSAAKAVLDGFISRHSDHGGALTSRARVWMKLKMPREALSDYRAALSQTPNAEPDLVQEVVEALISEQQSEEAGALLEVHLKRLGNSPGLVMKALELEIALGRYDAALARVDVLKQTAPRPEPWMARRASVLAQAGRIRESQAAWLALITHLQALPNLERGAHAMQLIAEQAHQALASLKSLSQTTPPTP